MSMDETVDYLTVAIEQKRLTHVITANPIMVMSAVDDPKYAEMMKRADLIVPDGAGVVWAAKFAGNPVTERVTGIELINRLLQQGEPRRWRVYLLGTSQDIIDSAAEKLQLQYPQVRIVGSRNGFFGPEQDDEVIDAIRAAEPDLLFVARGAETQEPWIVKYKKRLGVPLVMGVGGSFDVISGKLKRAPVLFQKLRLEWLFRLLQEPKRYKRMLALPKFVVKVLRDKENVTKPRAMP
ncbi:WecB/TagA/CpsF family glycosyltransferase [Paenibacillus arenilitoris]|uniref:N-acetylglucosaminyldiphosphoundecaprenol N-acetyl-beta-D-mannosaminyltransferase n=1 Tax=Paenibacillus arenilitoris TaxID=2772299 RepID=A0A927CMM1_9BACL|nr:WecB/TagA/CpsF family glycosyltransferase [Paenibacillus arenilitoris]MBD2868390.1 WecB/TagA/CpsF family glycosyltransferase [Paenibacillus arenilitoris]